MQDYDVIIDNECTRLLELYGIGTSTETKYEKRPISTHEFIQELGKDSYCLQTYSTVPLIGATSNYNRNRPVMRTAPIDRAVQKAISMSPRAHVSFHLHYRTIAGHSGEICIYYLRQCKYHWPHVGI